jgi:predicted cupin superfamily sugar epimerase
MGREARNGVQTGLGLSISLPVNAEAQQIISRLGMKKLPGEGGFFVPTWTSSLKGQGGRPLNSSILFLITGAEFSALHRLQMDEIWHFSAGDPAELVAMGPRGDSCRVLVMGADLEAGQVPQAIVQAGEWQGARIREPAGPGARGWALFGCTVSPAWDERDFELGRRDALLDEFPAHAELVRGLTR